jgi:hypothetical protein
VLSNTLKDGGVSSAAEGGCSRYRVTGVHGTNLFIGIVEPSTNCTTTAAAFCPCSVHDRWCMLCDERGSKKCNPVYIFFNLKNVFIVWSIFCKFL